MRHQDQIIEARKLLSYLDTRTTAMAADIYRNPVTDYTCPKQAAQERESFFRRGAINIGLSCLLPEPGDFMTHDYTGVPILLVRRADGSLGCFLNVCRHRGSRVADGSGKGARNFSCPYHGWSYGLDGALVARPDDRSFAAYDKSRCSLRALPVVEKYGMIWASASPDAPIDVDAMLDGAAADLAAYRLDSYHHYETRVLRRRINWKLAVDTFLESYHIGVLHRATISPILHTNCGTFDGFGRNLRLIIPRRKIEHMREVPEAEWDLVADSAIIYVLFPNTVFIMQGDHVETWHVFPEGEGAEASVMYISLYTPAPATTDSARRHWDKNFDLLMATVEHEDFPLSDGIQRGFHSGAQAEIVFGRNEPALQHFHKSVKAALAAG